MKYPKEWLEALIEWDCNREGAEDCLDVLNRVGALKELPKPREYWVVLCDDGMPMELFESNRAALDEANKMGCALKPVHVREVLDET